MSVSHEISLTMFNFVLGLRILMSTLKTVMTFSLQ